jgi:hypothetical protein
MRRPSSGCSPGCAIEVSHGPQILFIIDGSNALRAAVKLSSAEEGEKRLGQIARQLEHGHSPAAHSLRGGMKEMFTLQRLKIPASLAHVFGDGQPD